MHGRAQKGHGYEPQEAMSHKGEKKRAKSVANAGREWHRQRCKVFVQSQRAQLVAATKAVKVAKAAKAKEAARFLFVAKALQKA